MINEQDAELGAGGYIERWRLALTSARYRALPSTYGTANLINELDAELGARGYIERWRPALTSAR